MALTSTFSRVALFLVCAGVCENVCAMQEFAGPSQQMEAMDVEQESLLTPAQQIMQEQAEEICAYSLLREAESILRACSPSTVGGDSTDLARLQQELEQKAAGFIQACKESGHDDASMHALVEKVRQSNNTKELYYSFSPKFILRTSDALAIAVGLGNKELLNDLANECLREGNKEMAERIWNVTQDYSLIGNFCCRGEPYKKIAYFRKAGLTYRAAYALSSIDWVDGERGEKWPPHAYAALLLLNKDLKAYGCAHEMLALCSLLEDFGYVVDEASKERAARSSADAARTFADDCMRRNQYAKAIEFFEIAAPKEQFCLGEIAKCYAALGELQKADEAFQRNIAAVKALQYQNQKDGLDNKNLATLVMFAVEKYGRFLRDKKNDYEGAKKQFEQAGCLDCLADLYLNQFNDPVRAEALYYQIGAVECLANLWEKSTVPWQQELSSRVKKSFLPRFKECYWRGFCVEHSGIKINGTSADYWYEQSLKCAYDGADCPDSAAALARVAGIKRAKEVVSELKEGEFKQQAQASLDEFERTKADAQATAFSEPVAKK